MYSKRAIARRSGLPKELKHFSWLGLDEEDGIEYWNAMNLMAAQTDLVEILGRFDPKLVKMAAAGEKAED